LSDRSYSCRLGFPDQRKDHLSESIQLWRGYTTDRRGLGGWFFYVLEFDHHSIQKIIFKKLVDDRIYDIIDYFQENGRWAEKIIDQERYNALKAGEYWVKIYGLSYGNNKLCDPDVRCRGKS